MKVAVTYDNGNVFQHFGRTENFKLYDVQGDVVTPGEVVNTNGVGHEALADFLAERGVETVICGGLGGGAMAALQAAGIQVVAGAEGNADEAVRAWVNGELTDSGVNCDHHHEEGHECGHGCGGNGCGGCGHHAVPPIEGKNVGRTVRVHYEGTFDDGTKFDSSYDRNEPLEFECGSGMMIRGFDEAVANMEKGEIVNVHLMPEQAYGMPNPDAVFTFRISELPGSENLQAGQRVHIQMDNGQIIPVRVTAKDDENITLDANHEMAGKELNFKIEMVDIL